MIRNALCIASAVLLTSGFLPAVETTEGNDGGRPFYTSPSSAFLEIQNRAYSVAGDAAGVEQSSPQFHDSYLNQMKDDISYMQQQLVVLRNQEETLAPRERDALVKEGPLLREADAKVDSAMEYWNANQDHIRGDKTYHEYIKAIRDNCNDAADLLKPVLHQPHTPTWRKIVTLGYGW